MAIKDQVSTPISLINGQPAATATLNDRGFNYGDGLFESMLLEKGRISLLTFHLSRLQKGCLKLAINYCEKNVVEQLDLAIEQALKEKIEYAKIKLTVTRGDGGIATYPPNDSIPNIYIQITHLPLPAENINRVALSIASEPLSHSPQLAGLKHLNRLPYIVACLSIERKTNEEILFLDTQQHVIETMHHNIFLVKHNTLYTPKLDKCGVEGVMKSVICERLAQEINVNVKEKNISMADLNSFDEVFISNAVRGFSAVTRIAQYAFNSHSICEKLSSVFERVKSGL